MKPSGNLKRTPFRVPLNEDGTPRWSTLNRYTGLSASAGSRIGRLAVVSGDGAPVVTLRPKQQRREGGFPAAFTPKVRGLIHARSGGFCEACGKPLPDGRGQCQHRVARGMGGSRNPLLGSAVNGADLCGTPQSGCHGLCEARDEGMYRRGFWLHSWQDPTLVRVTLFTGQKVWLTEGDRYRYEPPEGAA